MLLTKNLRDAFPGPRMTRLRTLLHRLRVLVVMAASAAAQAQSQSSPTRGELLYTTHCVACHTTQMHWREQRLATNWDILKALVQRWQSRARLAWSDDDVLEVARHLNDTIYRYPQTSGRVSLLTR